MLKLRLTMNGEIDSLAASFKALNVPMQRKVARCIEPLLPSHQSMSIVPSFLRKVISSKILCVLFILLIECYAVMELFSIYVASNVRSSMVYGVLAIIVSVAVVLVAKKVKCPLFVSSAVFWCVFLMAAIFNLSLNYEVHTTVHQLPNALMVTASLLLLSYAVCRRYFVVLWVPLLCVLAFVNIAYHEYDIVVDSTVLAQIQNATLNEICTYTTFRNLSLTCLFLVAIGLALWALHRVMKRERRLSLLCSGVLLLMFCIVCRQYLQPLRCNVSCGLWPVKSMSNFAKTAYAGRMSQDKFIASLQALTSPADDESQGRALNGNEGIVIIFHIGESVRADHLSINGYHRETTPHLKQVANIVNFRGCTASSGLTSYAWPVIFTNARRGYNINKTPEYQATRGSFVDLLDKHGFRCYAVLPSDFVGADSVARIVHKLLISSKETHVHGNGHAESLGIIRKIVEKGKGKNKFIVLNDCGSHFPFGHYDDECAPFLPTSRSAFGNAPNKNADEAEKALNAYDNTIHHLDHYIHKAMGVLQGLPYIYIYVSDHGEAVGEEGEWRRSFSFQESSFYAKQASQVPFFLIYSDELLQHPHFKQTIAALHSHSTVRTAHEHIYHTMLGLLGIQAESHDASLDLTSPHVQPYAGPHPDDAAHAQHQEQSAP